MDIDGGNCPDCGKYFKRKSLLRVHFMREQKNSTLSVCRLCKLTFVLKKNLVIHEQLHHATEYRNTGRQGFSQFDSGDIGSEETLPTETLPSPILPDMSVTNHNETGSNISEKSERSLKSVTSQSGKYISTTRDKFPCKYCGLVIARQCHLKRHQKFSCKVLKSSKTLFRNFTHPKKSKGLRLKSSLGRLSERNNRSASATITKPIVCILCDHRFTAKRGLRKHLREACRYRNMQCAKCEDHFKDVNDFKKHLQEFHQEYNVSGIRRVSSMLKMVPLDKKPKRSSSTSSRSSLDTPTPTRPISTTSHLIDPDTKIATSSSLSRTSLDSSTRIGPFPTTSHLMDPDTTIATSSRLPRTSLDPSLKREPISTTPHLMDPDTKIPTSLILPTTLLDSSLKREPISTTPHLTKIEKTESNSWAQVNFSGTKMPASETETKNSILSDPRSMISDITYDTVPAQHTVQSLAYDESMEHRTSQIKLSQQPSWLFETLSDTMCTNSEIENKMEDDLCDTMYIIDLMNESSSFQNE